SRHELREHPRRHRPARHSDMAVAETVQDIRRSRGPPDDRKRIRQAWAKTHPLLETILAVGSWQAGEHAPYMIEQDARAAPVRRQLQAAQFDGAGETQA